MGRPRLFDGDRESINIYLDKDLKEFLGKQARAKGMSPSAYIRYMLKQERGDIHVHSIDRQAPTQTESY